MLGAKHAQAQPIVAPGPDDDPGRTGLRPRNDQRQSHHFVTAGQDMVEIQPFDNHDAGSQQHAVDGLSRIVVAVYGQTVHAHGRNLLGHHPSGGLRTDTEEVLAELLTLPQ